MTSINLGSEILSPTPNEAPGHKRVQRRASAPELAKLITLPSSNDNYAVGNIIRLQLPHTSQDSKTPRVVQAEIVKVFSPFTMAPVMVVRIHKATLDLEGDFVLKVYDRRYTNEAREDYHFEEWSTELDLHFESRRWNKDVVKYFLKLMAHDSLFYDLQDEEEDEEGSEVEEDEEDEGEAKAYGEVFLHAFCLKMYRAELEVYRRARQHSLDGIDIPRFISSVRIPYAYTSKHCPVSSSNIKGTPGILLQYIPGFPLMDLYASPSPRPSRSTWQPLIDSAVRIANTLSQTLETRNIDCNPRNTVVHWDPLAEKWECKLIDFGHCQFRKENMSEWEWRRFQSTVDEDAAMGREMEIFLTERKGGGYVYTRSQYQEELDRDFRRDD
ncbi:uncharacterized protein K460DRAFT_361953 [Cucurbitaria berberidis CBS 394.84]|uniref:Protein kinase domain-containing protein n=1 Tax=Cucurbitaria berberidis CBS 394.84 TaxID=1168544 RepID=A0A9P4GTU9_9PLEO|nr:uncharacterized protein K460DRAFT_361953 [Cucurbitaria berberidis CBS 394.84]KAF1851184.1 hypothetical protein K460DRAFT_361953 [Cucurbitaria berberidis CBS 394.84]